MTSQFNRYAFYAIATLVLFGCSDEACGRDISELQPVCAVEGDEITEAHHAFCSDSSMCNGIEWCDPTSPYRDARNCVVTNPCNTARLSAALTGENLAPDCTEPTEESDVRRKFGTSFRACQTDCDEEYCYEEQNGVVRKGLTLVQPQDEQGDLTHVDGKSYDIGCLRAACTQTICTPDTICDDDLFCNGLEQCVFGIGCAVRNLPCEELAPKGEEGFYRCIEEEDRCEWVCEDNDGDGFGAIICGGTDCDDNDAERYPGNTEICDDGHDEDCDLQTVGNLDMDRDGYVDSMCRNVTDEGETAGLDCDDMNPAIHGGQNEVCNGVDDDCDGDVDEEVRVELYVDEDGDGFGVGDAQNGCPGPGFSYVDGDCDDENPSITPGEIVCGEPYFDAQQNEIWPFELCQVDGTWADGECPEQCFPQPNGTGVCH